MWRKKSKWNTNQKSKLENRPFITRHHQHKLPWLRNWSWRIKVFTCVALLFYIKYCDMACPNFFRNIHSHIAWLCRLVELSAWIIIGGVKPFDIFNQQKWKCIHDMVHNLWHNSRDLWVHGDLMVSCDFSPPVRNPFGMLGSTTFVMQSEMVNHFFHQGLGLCQVIYLHITQ